MTNGLNATVVIVPGLRDHVPDHWQTLLADELPGSVTVPRMQMGKLSCTAWVDALDRTLDTVEGPVVLVAHSAGAMIVVHWAQRRRRAIVGALLAAPPDFESPLPAPYPTMDVLQSNGWLPTPRAPLPFPSIVAAGADDPLGRIERVEAMARDWGSRFVDLGNVGHLNPASGYGPWPDAHPFIRALAA